MTDKQTLKFINSKRRGFLQGAAVAGGAVASGAVAGSESLLDAAEQAGIAGENPVGKKGYERTDHVSKYYSRARF